MRYKNQLSRQSDGCEVLGILHNNCEAEIPSIELNTRRFSVPANDEGKMLQVEVEECFTDDFRPRAYSLPAKLVREDKPCASDDQYFMSDRKLFAILTNVVHIIIGIAMIQLGIVGTWYQRYMNFERDQLRHVLYMCIMFIVLGVYGLCVATKNLGKNRSHQLLYLSISLLSIVASSFIMTNGALVVISDTYRTNQRVIVIFDLLIIILSGLEIPAAIVGLCTIVKPADLNSTILRKDNTENKNTSSTSWNPIFNLILNISHIVLGLCIAELSFVGLLYRRFMNIDHNNLLAIIIISFSFISIGATGIYNYASGKKNKLQKQSTYTCGPILAVGSAASIMVVISIATTNKQYYVGVEAIKAFDTLILSISGVELVVGTLATILCFIPCILTKLEMSQKARKWRIKLMKLP